MVPNQSNCSPSAIDKKLFQASAYTSWLCSTRNMSSGHLWIPAWPIDFTYNKYKTSTDHYFVTEGVIIDRVCSLKCPAHSCPLFHNGGLWGLWFCEHVRHLGRLGMETPQNYSNNSNLLGYSMVEIISAYYNIYNIMIKIQGTLLAWKF